MKPYFYPGQDDTFGYRRITSTVNRQTLAPFGSSSVDTHPNDIAKYRAARIINLLQQLINRGAHVCFSNSNP